MKISFELTRSKSKSAATTPQDEILRRAFPGFYDRPGITVTESSANTFSAVYACRRILAEMLASTPLILYRDNKPGDKSSGKTRAVEHPLYRVLHDSWNKYMPAFIGKETAMWDLTGSGNAYALKLRTPGGVLAGLQYIPSWDMEIRQTDDKRDFYYRRHSTQTDYAWDDVFHIPATSKDGITGLSPIRVAMDTIGLGLAAQRYGSRFFENGGSVSGALTHPAHLSEEAADSLKAQWQELYTGASNAGKTVILEEGMKYERMGIPPEEAQFLETRKFQIDEIARIYRVPPHLLQNLEHATFSNIEHQSIDFVQYTMLPWYERWEAHADTQLLSEEDREKGYFTEFLVDNLLRGDQLARAKRLHVMRNDGVINADEWRELETMNPIPDGSGQVYVLNGNFNTVDSLRRDNKDGND